MNIVSKKERKKRKKKESNQRNKDILQTEEKI